MSRRFLYAVLLVVVLLACGVAWYWFRPEKAFVNDRVNEPPPPGVPADIEQTAPAHAAHQVNEPPPPGVPADTSAAPNSALSSERR